MDNTSTALYVKVAGREWIAWTVNDDIMAIPGDEKPYGDKELTNLRSYLEEEGFFPEFFNKITRGY